MIGGSYADQFGGAPLTVTQAAARVGRTRRTIENWIADDLPATTVDGVRYVSETQLLAKYRAMLKAPKGGKGKPRHL